MTFVRHVALIATVASATCLFGCTSLLGDFQQGGGGPDASLAETGNGNGEGGPGADDASGDATTQAQEGGDAFAPDAGEGGDASNAGDSPTTEEGGDGSSQGGCAAGQISCGDAGTCMSPTDPRSCGECGHDCTNLPHVSGAVTCQSGACTFSAAACAAGFSDCNGTPDDGCEADLSQAGHCGSCTTQCTGATPVCTGTGDAGTAFGCASGCPANFPTLCGSSCVDLTKDAQNCRACGTPCPVVSNAQATCSASTCGFSCNSGYHLCSGACAANVSPASCGTSCTACTAPANATATCDGTNCGFTCNTGYHLCSGACVANNSVSSCGTTSCTACSAPSNATSTCDGTSCGFSCSGGFHACGSSCSSNTSPASCGTSSCVPCSAPGNATATCDGTSCGYTCNTGFHGCGGACADDTSINSCGSSCTACTPPANSTATCNGTSCGFSCTSGFHACGSACADSTSINSCGSLCTACAPPANSTATCSAGSCGFTCTSGFHVCSGACADNTSINSCGSSCTACTPPANATATCNSTTGTCGFTCNSGFSLCGGVCVNLLTDPNNCKVCGATCTAPQTACSSGVCGCPASTPSFCAGSTGGTCVDFTTDKLNCGSCGHSCLGGACSAGVCQPLQISGVSAYAVAVDASSAYFTDTSGGHVYKCPLTGCTGTPTVLRSGLTYAASIYYDSGSAQVFAADSRGGVLYALSTGGALNFSVAAPGGGGGGYPNPGGFYADSTYIYWGNNGNGSPEEIARANKTTGAGVIGNNVGPYATYALAYDPGTHNLFAAQFANTGLYSCPIGGGSCANLSAPIVTGVAVVGSNVYYSVRGTSAMSYNDGGIFTAPTSLASSSALVTGNSNYSPLNGGMTADASGVYWGGQSSSIYKCAISGCGGTPTAITTGSYGDPELTTDATAIYWACGSGVFRLAK